MGAAGSARSQIARAANGEGGDAALARFILDLRSKGITDPMLMNGFEAVPRAVFLPHVRPGLLYEPIALPLPCGEQATDPFTLARLLLLLAPKPGQHILEIGTGSGYFTAILATCGAHIRSVERYRTLLLAAQARFSRLGMSHITLVHADGLALQSRSVPRFDRILIDGALDIVPAHLFDLLAPDGQVLAHRQIGGATYLTIWRKTGQGAPLETSLGPSRAAPMRRGLPACL